MRPWPISIEDVTAARQRLRPYLTMTPLRSFPLLDAELDVHAFVKCENHQPTNAFKVRNALSALTGLEESQRAQGFGRIGEEGCRGISLGACARSLGSRAEPTM